MTKKQIVDDILALAERQGFDDSTLRGAQVGFWVDSYRSKLMKEYYAKYGVLNSAYVQDLGCIELECVDQAACCDLHLGSYVLRTKRKIPKRIEFPESNGLVFVGLIDKVTVIPLYDVIRIGKARYNRFTGRDTKAYLIEDYIYIDTYPGNMLQYINVRAYLEDPEAAAEFTRCKSSEPCFSFDTTPYPVPGHLIPIITDLIIKDRLQVSLAAEKATDMENNTSIQP